MERTVIGPAEAPLNRARSSRNGGRNHLGTPSEIKSEWWATSSRIRGRLPPESAICSCQVDGALARSPIRDPLPEGFRHFVASMPAPVASDWSGCRMGLAPTGKRRLVTAHALCGHCEFHRDQPALSTAKRQVASLSLRLKTCVAGTYRRIVHGIRCIALYQGWCPPMIDRQDIAAERSYDREHHV